MTTNATKYLIGNRFIFDPNDNSLIDKCDNNELTRLGSNESRALSLLIEDPSLIITRQRIHDYVWREQGFEVDDSSLTQAISTLRKALKDSTKSPEFVKTVPKRGYQMIASVEGYVCQKPQLEPSVDEPAILSTPPEFEPILSTPRNDLHLNLSTAAYYQQVKEQTESKSTLISWKGWLALMVAFILPIIVNISMPPKSAAFSPLFDVDGVTIYTPKNNPEIKQWHSMIKTCVSNYIQYHNSPNQKPFEIIVTGGQNNQLYLNYLHNSKVPAENVTVRLLTSDKDNSNLCR
ncbi:transcriptional regulator [Photobacterium kishitanii]|uniref:Transcriptional regulator n=1 Tax=Photobacterium kishitanii TaxID=318456 RepID=A0A0B7JEP6_9GAMM|nr:transcriptional regulator [Photobacterium kishitanii]OBU22746.1 transcriptional regulator [Photobacterium kishitanii]PSU90142.1 transcriptional regulator [Photobacterium kishitanii]PSU97270.1 transcriptional regulator [Photobacterium kishitanii]PSV01618.1 transcriptional regulator [Photobacterium kishitanii]PSW71184.1 transcriptional regulator [Photobacterium kishitanii]